MKNINYHYQTRLIAGMILSLCLLGFVHIEQSHAAQPLAKHYPQKFDFDGYVHNINIAKQNIVINGYPYGMSLETTAYGLKGEKISLLSLTSKTKVGVQVFPFVKGQKRVVSKIWVLPSDYKLRAKPL